MAIKKNIYMQRRLKALSNFNKFLSSKQHAWHLYEYAEGVFQE